METKFPQSTPRVEIKRPPSTPKVLPTPAQVSAQPRPTPSPAVNAIPQAIISASSPDVQKQLQKPQSKKPQQKRPSLQGTETAIAKPTKPPVDYQVLLLSLADEYLNAAHRHGTKLALATRHDDVEEYYKLVATGLGCLEAVLKVLFLSFCPLIL